jgi:uncharacterized membrane protein
MIEILLGIAALVISILAYRKASDAYYIATREGERVGRPLSPEASPAPLPPAGYNPSASPALAAEDRGPDLITRFIAWWKEEWLMKLGALIILIGFGWFVTYAFMNDWVGPVGRITLGLIAGAALLALGWKRMTSFAFQGSIVMGLGSSVVLLTMWAARYIYDFFDPLSSLLIMFGSAAIVALASYIFRIRSLAVLSVLIAGFVPALVNGDPNDLGLWSYIFVVVLGAIGLVMLTGDRVVTAAALLVVTLWSMPYLLQGMYVEYGLVFAYLFAAAFFLATTAGIVHRADSAVSRDDIMLIVWNGALLFFWVWLEAPKDWQSLILSFWTLVFMLGAVLVFRATSRKEPLLVYAAVGIAYLGAATAIELSGATLLIAFSLEAAALPVIAYMVLRDVDTARHLFLLFAVPIALSFDLISDAGRWRDLFNEDFFALLTLTVCLLSSGAYIIRESGVELEHAKVRLSGATFIIGTVYGLLLYWLSLTTLFGDDVGILLSIISYALIGLPLYRAGVTLDLRAARIYGTVLLSFVACYLIFFLADIDLEERIIAAFVVGGLFMATAFWRRKQKADITSSGGMTPPPTNS